MTSLETIGIVTAILTGILTLLKILNRIIKESTLIANNVLGLFKHGLKRIPKEDATNDTEITM